MSGYGQGFPYGGAATYTAPGISPASMEGFDRLLILRAQIYEKGAGATDNYGIESQALNLLAADVPCRVSTDAFGRPHEFKDDTKLSLNYRRVFMRSPVLSNGDMLNPHHVLLINEIYYDIFEVLPLYDSANLHHLEVIVEEVKV